MNTVKIIAARQAIEKAASATDAETIELEKFCAGIVDFAKEAGMPEDQHAEFVAVVLDTLGKEAANAEGAPTKKKKKEKPKSSWLPYVTGAGGVLGGMALSKLVLKPYLKSKGWWPGRKGTTA